MSCDASRLLLAMANFETDLHVTCEKQVLAVLDDYEETLNPEDPSRLFAKSLYTATLTQQGQAAQGDTIFEGLLEKQRRILGSKHRDTIWTMLQWAGSYCWRGRGTEAERLAGEAYRNATETYSPDDALSLQAATTYALALTFRGQDRKAEEIARPALVRGTRVLGETNKVRLFSLFALARSLSWDDHPDEVDALYDQYRRGGWGEWVGARDLGDLRMWLGKYDEALDVFKEEHQYWNGGERRSEHVNQERLNQIEEQAMSNYRRALVFLERWDEAREFVREEIAAVEARAGSEEATAQEWNELAWMLATCEPKDLRRPEEALRWVNRAVEVAEKGDFNDPGEAANFYDTQAMAFYANGDLENAIAAERISVERFAQEGDLFNLPTCAAMAVRYLTELEGIAAAREEVARIVTLSVDTYGAGTEDLANVLGEFGFALQDLGLHQLAGEPCRRALETTQESAEKKPILDATTNLAHFHLATDSRQGAATALGEAKALYHELFAGEPIEWTLGLGYTGEGERSAEAVDAKSDIALCLIEIGRLEEAGQMIEQIRCVSDNRARYPAARLLLAKGDPAAEEAFRKVCWSGRFLVEAAPGRYAKREIDYARALLLNGKRAEARRCLKRARERALDWCGPESAYTKEATDLLGGL